MFTVASRFRRLNFVGSYLSTIEAVGTGSWLSVVQVLLDVSIALLVAIIEFHGGIHRGYRTISSEFFFVKRYTQSHLRRLIEKKPVVSYRSGFQLFTRVGNPIFASYLGHLPTYLLFLVDFLRKTNLPTYYKSSYFQ